jgi:hypothetical protein
MVYQMLPENYRRFKMDFAVAYDEKVQGRRYRIQDALERFFVLPLIIKLLEDQR